MSRRASLMATALLLLAACGGPADDPMDASAGTDAGIVSTNSEILEEVTGSPPEQVPSALQRIDDPALPDPLVDTAEVISGGPPPDGIPPIDTPRFVPAADVNWLTPDEPVLAPAIGSTARAYPVRIMIWHEVVNDSIDGRPVVVTYCPLCNSALAFDRRLGDRLLTFGTSGLLYRSDLVMYDRQTESLFSQIEGRAIAGVLAGAELEQIPVQTVTWSQWQQANPDGWVLSRETGVSRDYGANPYTGYDSPDGSPLLFEGEPDPRLPAMQRVAGLGAAEDPVAVPLADLVETGVVELTVGSRTVVVWAVEGLRSPLEGQRVHQGRAIGATGAFDPVVDGNQLQFSREGDHFVDAGTGSRWNVLGHAVDGPLAGTRLEPVKHLDTFWFAWAAFHPATRIADIG